jgi:hypothetical protein
MKAMKAALLGGALMLSGSAAAEIFVGLEEDRDPIIHCPIPVPSEQRRDRACETAPCWCVCEPMESLPR